MLFNSYTFIFLFLPITFVLFFGLNRMRLTRAAKGWMVFASLFFYSWWNISYLPLILGSILVNFTIGTRISHAKDKGISPKLLIIMGISFNVLLLAYFKYMDFFITNFNTFVGTDFDLIHIVLPLGISFFTFTQIAYLVDAYRGEVKEMDYLNYTLFVTFFPHLLAGPILHHKEMMPQFDSLKSKCIQPKNIALGVFLFSMGLFKKVVIADTFALWANSGFGSPSVLNFFEAWITSLSYTFQLYFDFSGYTDMALGAALLFNIKMPINFNSPYKALDIQDFWRRWHITLSRFLRDYIYIPLGGNRRSELRTYENLFIVFLIGGLWHGASWMFIIWGGLHAVAIVLHRAWQRTGLKIHTFLAWFITINFINITWVFFRAKNWEDAHNVLMGMTGAQGIALPSFLAHKLAFLGEFGVTFGRFVTNVKGDTPTLFILLAAFVFVLLLNNSMQLVRVFKPTMKFQLWTAIMLAFGILSLTKISEFLYFNF